MPKEWTGDAVKMMHVNDISVEDLSKEVGISKSYVSMILHSKCEPEMAEEKIVNAIKSIVERRSK